MDREVGRGAWNVWRGVIGAFYLLSAVFNGVFTLPRSSDEEIFDGYADGAWFGFLEDFMRDVFIPNAAAFMVTVIIAEVAIGLAMWSKDRWVDAGVLLSIGWVIAILPFLAWPYLLVNVALAGAQGLLLLRAFDTPLWELIRGRLSRASHLSA